MGLAGAQVDAAEIGAITEFTGHTLDQLDGLAIDLWAFLEGTADCRDRKTESRSHGSQGHALTYIATQAASYRQSLHLRQIIPLRHVGARMPAGG